MSPSRIERKTRSRGRHKNAWFIGGALVLSVCLLAAWALISRPAEPLSSGSLSAASSPAEQPNASPSGTAVPAEVGTTSTALSTPAQSDNYLAYATAPASSESTPIEVPDVVGSALPDARTVLAAADLKVVCSVAGTDATACVTSQRPEAGSIVSAGTPVTVAIASPAVVPVKAQSLPVLTVCIDPGHQAHSSSSKEPVGPGSKIVKPKVAGGATGVRTHVPEYEVALEIATNLRARLRKAGIRVVMTRTTNDVNLSNAQRAQIANRAGAALFVRIHANGSTDARKAGFSTLYPGKTKWTTRATAPSRRAAVAVQRAALGSTSAIDDGIHPRTDLAGFNWCTRPAILVECGYLSNPVEDRLLTSPKYQDKLAAGIAAGVLRALGR